MKKGIMICILVLIGTFSFAAEETSRFKLSSTVAEGVENAGIKLVAGDPIGSKPEGVLFTTHFDNTFFQASDNLTVDAGDAVMTADVTGIFTVLVKRDKGNPLTVNITATPMQNEDGSAHYIGYQIKESGQATAMINTISNPSSSTTGISYTAVEAEGTSGNIRDARVLEYRIPKTTSVPQGTYTLTVYFSITLE